jgi:phosphate transport system substrate-binding protein
MRFLTAALAMTLTGLTISAHAQSITGAGGTFPAPVYTKWAEAAKAATGVELNYQAIGSGGGQSQILARTVDFGASDAPMDPAKLVSGNLLQFPTVIGAVVVIVNIPGIEANKLRLSGEVVAGIYAGDITRWNDEKIKALNPGVTLPRTAIASVHRADGSGTSYVFTSYLSAVSPTWKDKIGANTSVNWPTGAGARGNDGVAATVKNTEGGIGYVEYAYASQNKLITTQLQDHDGAFISPTMDSFAAGATNADWAHAKDYAVDLINQKGANAWPILSTTFIELPKDPKDLARSAAVVKFFDWAYTSGDAIATQLQYIPLPAAVKDDVRKAWHTQLRG